MKMLSVGSQGVVNLILDKVEIQTTLGGFELVFWLQGQTVTPNPDYWALVHSADVLVDGAQGRLAGLGLARPATPLRFATRPTPSTVSVQFRLSVTAHQLAAIETLRNCGDLTFKLVVSGEGGPRSDPDRIERIHEDFWLREERSAWIDKLVAAKALDVTLLEIPMPFVDPPEAHRTLTETLRRAQHLFAEGRYPESITCCRTALDALAVLEGRAEGWANKALERCGTDRRGMTKEQRQLAVEGALVHFSHLGAHPNEVQLDRRDAKLVIALTASLLAFHAG
ncbi:hypothetical protein [Caulobacter segnis]|uniref:hypothetical protein n=1 Tax=Caulobacter segnis TaxID=88688 RepID=UPI001CBFBD64|nr:hypothetical protein [Caulobacter segnis]UAL10217.1 hypothetical protein K8940_21005 [Caulobacter segnis]